MLCFSHEFRYPLIQEFWKQISDLGPFKFLTQTPIALFRVNVCSQVPLLCP